MRKRPVSRYCRLCKRHYSESQFFWKEGMDLHIALHDFCFAIVSSLGIIRFLDWLDRKLSRNS